MEDRLIIRKSSNTSLQEDVSKVNWEEINNQKLIWTKKPEIKIGRAMFCEKSIKVLNDIILPNQDSAASREHCSIKIHRGFQKTWIPNTVIRLLLVCKNNPLWMNLPYDILRIILVFLKKPRKFIIEDLNSLRGTKIYIPNEGLTLKPKELYVLGPEQTIMIEDLQNESINYTEGLFRNLPLEDEVEGNFTIIGENHRQELLEDSLKNYEGRPGVPYIRIFNPSTLERVTFVCTPPKSEFIISRHSEWTDYAIENLTVSRNQCTIFFNYGETKWKIMNGNIISQLIPSNPTFLLLKKRIPKSDYRFEFTSNARVYISNTILEISYENH